MLDIEKCLLKWLAEPRWPNIGSPSGHCKQTSGETGHLVGVCWSLYRLQAAHKQHEEGIQNHQPPQVVCEDRDEDVAQHSQLHHTSAGTQAPVSQKYKQQ
jgi:hypothetical protein